MAGNDTKPIVVSRNTANTARLVEVSTTHGLRSFAGVDAYVVPVLRRSWGSLAFRLRLVDIFNRYSSGVKRKSTSSPPLGDFDRTTAVRRHERRATRYAVELDESWASLRGVHGGY